MRTLHVFESVSLDGYFRKPDGDISWTHEGSADPEFQAFVADNASGGGELLLGRTTFEMMRAFWPTPMAAQQMPAVARRMNEMTKYVVSHSLGEPGWQNTRVLRSIDDVRALKAQPGPSITVLGSGTLVAQLAEADLVDSYQLVVLPVVLGAGRTVFDGTHKQIGLALTSTRAFRNGRVVMSYERAA